MKKPNITNGRWAANAGTVWMHEGKSAVCHPLNDAQSVVNARAIAALPDLLAALEAALLRLDSHDAQSAPEALQIREALKKAGYTFNE